MRPRLLITALLLLCVAGCGSRESVSISATPTVASWDVPIDLRVAHLAPDTTVTLQLRGRRAHHPTWSGTRTVKTDARGTLRLPDFYPVAWMHQHGSEKLSIPTTLTIAADGARVTVKRAAMPPVLTHPTPEPLAKTGFFGSWHAPPGAHHHTAILLFGGSEGGLGVGVQWIADTLAAHGYPVLAVAYFAEPGLPRLLANIRLEYFRSALRWLARQPQVDPKHMVTFGISRGGELSLLLAATFPDLIHGAVGYVPSSRVNDGYDGASDPAWRYRGKPIWAGIPIAVQRINGPVFVVGGGSDALWPSAASVREIAQELHGHDRSHDDITLVYPDAGHLVGEAVPQLVVPPARGYGWVTDAAGTFFLGGSPRADETAREQSWPQLLTFLSRVRSGG
jgi:dienelactone hydrolase